MFSLNESFGRFAGSVVSGAARQAKLVVAFVMQRWRNFGAGGQGGRFLLFSGSSSFLATFLLFALVPERLEGSRLYIYI
jgi:hypothetical protein